MNVFELVDEHYKMQQGGKLGAGQYRTTTGNIVIWGTPEYEKAYNRGEVITDKGVKSPLTVNGGNLKEVVIQNNYKRNALEQYRDKIIEENKDAGVLGASVGVPISAVFSLPQLAMMKGLTGKMQRPSEAVGFENNQGLFESPSSFGKHASNFVLDAVTDPANLIGAGVLTKEKVLAGLARSTEDGILSNAHKLNPLAGISTSIPDSMKEGLHSNGFLDMLKRAKPSISSEAPVINNMTTPLADVSKNLEDLNYAKDWAKQYGYELPQNLERIAQSDELTNKTIRGMMNRHNTFVRGVSTNWDELAKRNPEILRHLEGKGFNLSTKEGTKQAAEYMATHVPIKTGYGRASLDKEVFQRGEDAIYTSNSIPTAEGYTYGEGYVTKVKKPTDFSSLDRKDWITKNNPSYIDEDEYRGMNFFNHPSSEEIINGVMKSPKHVTPEEKLIEIKKRFSRDSDMPGLTEDLEKLDKYGDMLFKSKYDDKLLRTEAINKNANPYFKHNENVEKFIKDNNLNNNPEFRQKFGESHLTKEALVLQGERQELLNQLEKTSGEKAEIIKDKLRLAQKQDENLYIQNTNKFLKENYPSYQSWDENKYAHYLHLGTPGEKILSPVKSWEITPDIWKNKSRAHTNEYSKKLSALSTLPIAGATYLATQGQEEPKKFQQGGKFTENEKKFLEELAQMKLI